MAVDQIFVSGCMSMVTEEIVGYKAVRLHRNAHLLPLPASLTPSALPRPMLSLHRLAAPASLLRIACRPSAMQTSSRLCSGAPSWSR